MIVNIEIPEFEDESLETIWDAKAEISVSVHNQQVSIMANAEGLMTLGKQMIYMAQYDFPWGTHLHYDEFVTGKKPQQFELIIGRV